MANVRIYELSEDTTPAADDYIATDKSGELTPSKVNVNKLLLSSGTITGSTSQAQSFGATGIKADVIAESTGAAGVTIDGVLLKDGGAVFADGATIEVDTVNEATAAAGVTVDGVKLKDGGAVFADGATIEVDTINEATAAAGVTVDGLLLKDGNVCVGNSYDVRFLIYVDKTVSTDVLRRAYYSQLRIDTTSTGITFEPSGIYGKVFFQTGSNTLTKMTGTYGLAETGAAGTVSDAYGVQGWIRNTGSGTMTRGYGVYIPTPTNSGGGSIGTAYGLYIDNQSVGTTKYAIFSNGGKSQLQSGASTVTPLVLKGASSQSANMLEVQDNSANILFAIEADGDIRTSKATANTNTPSGATAYQLAIYNAAGTLLGYIPIYGSAW